MQGLNVYWWRLVSPHGARTKTPFRLPSMIGAGSVSSWKLRGFYDIPPIKEPVGGRWGDSSLLLPWLLSGALLGAWVGLAVGIAGAPSNIAPAARPESVRAIKSDRMLLPVLAADECVPEAGLPHTDTGSVLCQPPRADLPKLAATDAKFGRYQIDDGNLVGAIPLPPPKPPTSEAQSGAIGRNSITPHAPADPVCGARGRIRYSRHGWRYWRCRR
jgi:hypothetical protein